MRKDVVEGKIRSEVSTKNHAIEMLIERGKERMRRNKNK